MIVLGIMQLVMIITITLYEYKNKSAVVFLWATLFVMFGIMNMISYCFPNYSYSKAVLDKASFFVILFCTFYFVTRFPLQKLVRKERKLTNSADITENRIAFWTEIILICAVFLYAFFIIRTSGSVSEVSKENVYRVMEKGNKIFLLSTYLYYATAPICLYCIMKKRYKETVLVVMLICIRSLFSSSRMDMIIIFVCIISCIILSSSKGNLAKIIWLGLLGILALFAIYSLRTFRYYYGVSSIGKIDIIDFMNKLVDFIKNDDGELGLRQVFYFFIEKNNNFVGFGTGDGYKRVLLLMIPSKLTLGLKPEDMCIVMGRAWKPEFKGIISYTVTPTLFGDCYANFGFAGCFMGIFWAIISTVTDFIIDRKSESIKLLLFGLIGTLYVDIGRGSVYNPLCYIWYCGLIICFIFFLRRIRMVRDW